MCKDDNCGLCDDLQDIKNDIAYWSNIFTKFNEINLQLKEIMSNLSRSNLVSPSSFLSTNYSKET